MLNLGLIMPENGVTDTVCKNCTVCATTYHLKRSHKHVSDNVKKKRNLQYFKVKLKGSSQCFTIFLSKHFLALLNAPHRGTELPVPFLDYTLQFSLAKHQNAVLRYILHRLYWGFLLSRIWRTVRKLNLGRFAHPHTHSLITARIAFQKKCLYFKLYMILTHFFLLKVKGTAIFWHHTCNIDPFYILKK